MHHITPSLFLPLQVVDAVVKAYDFAPFHTVVDVGGGYGALLSAILHLTPGLRGVLFDRPEVVEGAKASLASAGVLDRCEVVGGDMFAEIPRGGDAYVFSRVIHDWDDGSLAPPVRNFTQRGNLGVYKAINGLIFLFSQPSCPERHDGRDFRTLCFYMDLEFIVNFCSVGARDP